MAIGGQPSCETTTQLRPACDEAAVTGNEGTLGSHERPRRGAAARVMHARADVAGDAKRREKAGAAAGRQSPRCGGRSGGGLPSAAYSFSRL